MCKKVTIGLIGPGKQMQNYHIPYLEKRAKEKNDLEIVWISGYLDGHAYQVDKYRSQYTCLPEGGWRHSIKEKKPDAVLIALPNSLHEEAIKHALENDINVIVEKPTTTDWAKTDELVDLAQNRELIFVTISQRRFEDIYQTCKDIIENGGVGKPLIIHYMIFHQHFPNQTWESSKIFAGGGVFIASAFHGLDTILWLFKCHELTLEAQSVSAEWVIEYRDPILNEGILVPKEDRVEIALSATIKLNYGNNGCVLNVCASCESPNGSVDEEIKILGTRGTIQIIRNLPSKSDERAASLSYQHTRGAYSQYDSSKWVGNRTAPLHDFINALLSKKAGKPWSVLSPAKDSIKTLKIINAAYEAASSKTIVKL